MAGRVYKSKIIFLRFLGAQKIIIGGVNWKFRFLCFFNKKLKIWNVDFWLFLVKNEKTKDGFCKKMKSLPYTSTFIFPQKCIGGKL